MSEIKVMKIVIVKEFPWLSVRIENFPDKASKLKISLAKCQNQKLSNSVETKSFLVQVSKQKNSLTKRHQQ